MTKTFHSLSDKLDHYSIPEPNSGCLLWLGQFNADGYGRFRWRGKFQGAHRFAWENLNGPIPLGLSVCHRCDVRGCVNPHHLFLGSNADNVADRKEKGRSWRPKGTRHPSARLSEAEVLAIRANTHSTFDDLAREFGISRSQAHRIRTGQGWTHLPASAGPTVARAA